MSGTTDEERLLAQLCNETGETGWLEFKENNSDPQEIGEYISALANGAALAGRAAGYLVWGVKDGSHAIVGTTFNPLTKKGKGNEDLEPWLTRLLDPQVRLRFFKVPGLTDSVWILEIGAAQSRPVGFSGVEYIRVGSTKKPLRKYPEHERALWKAFEREVFANGIARARATENDVLELLDYPAYFNLLDVAMPPTQHGIFEHLKAHKLIAPDDIGWAITNLGAALFARRLANFDALERKRVRVIQYAGNNRVQTVHEREGERGYASGFEGLIDYITARLPQNEVIGKALRTEHTLYPEVAIRELVANMLIHQDFSITGTGPMVEIFDDRIEFTNPGTPIVDHRRFVDLPAQSRNEAVASMMRRAHIAEERGSGWDKVASSVELYQLPAPRVEVTPAHTRATLLAPQPLTKMAKDDRIRAVYLHASLRQVTNEHTTNASVRERFGIADGSAAQATRLLTEATDAGMITVFDPAANRRNRRYVPFWAVEEP